MMRSIGIERGLCRGMTLVEVLLAVAMLGMGLLIVVGALLSSFDATAVCENRLFAGDVLNHGLSEVQLVLEQPRTLAMSVPQEGMVRRSNRDFFWLVQQEQSDELSGVCVVQARVNWRESRGQRQLSRHVSLVQNVQPAEAL